MKRISQRSGRLLLAAALAAPLISALGGCASVQEITDRAGHVAKRAIGISTASVVATQGDFVLEKLRFTFPKAESGAAPTGLTLIANAGGDELYVVNGDTLSRAGVRDFEISQMAKTGSEPIDSPTQIWANARYLVLSSETTGTVQKIERETGRLVFEIKGLKAPRGAVELGDSSVLIAESGTGNIVKYSGKSGDPVTVLASGLATPSGMASAGSGIYVTETAAGLVLRIDPATGRRSIVSQGLQSPEGIAVDNNGRLVVMEVATKRLLSIDTVSGASTTLFVDVPIGPSKLQIGLAAGSDQTTYFTSPTEGAVFRIRRK